MIRVFLRASSPEERARLDALVEAHPDLEAVEDLADADAVLSDTETFSEMTADRNGDAPMEALTPRELEVLRLLAAGLGNKGIAARLEISEHTVKFHVASILGKLGVSSRTEAVTVGIRRGLIMI